MGGYLSLPNIRGRGNGARSNGQALSWPGRSYSYSPDSTYFSSHYYLGHRKFETGDPEVFLFGDMMDLNYLPPKPVKFPYKQPPKSQPLKTLRSFINVQRDSVKLVRVEGSSDQFRLRFTFDSDVPCQFTVFTCVSDNIEISALKQSRLRETDGTLFTTYNYDAGCEQEFKGHVIQPAELREEGYDPVNGLHTIPVALLMETADPDAVDSQQQALLSLCTLDNFGEDSFSIKIIKQKLLAGGMELLLQELYGLENKLKPKEASEEKKESEEDSDAELEDLGAECVICITDVRDTLLLPCRHLCLCSSCAANLRFQSSNCPICRAPFRALLQIRALEALPPDSTIDEDTLTGDPKYSIPGYKCVPLLQALNGYQLDEEEDDPTAKQENQTESSTTSPTSTSPTTSSPPPQTEAMTEFCVIHIEDGASEPVTSEPVGSPVRTMAKPQANVTKTPQHVNTDTIPLPGTPDTEHTPVGRDHNTSDASDQQASWCSSSVSSEVSVKSTDALIALNKN